MKILRNNLINNLYYKDNAINDNSNKSRSFYIDNLKFILILLVVVGHFGIKMMYIKEIKYFIYFIYLFHMPCFVFVSGYLAKGIHAGGKLRADKILCVLWMYLIFKLGNTFLAYAFNRKLSFGFFKDSSAPWYLLSLCTWYLLIPFIERIKAKYLIAATFLIGMLAGYISSIGKVFSMSRTLVFLPFFAIGFCLSEEKLKELLGRRLRLGALLFMTAVLGILLIFGKYFAPFSNIIYGSRPYTTALGHLAPYGFLIRGVWYLLALMMSISVLLLVPRCKLFFSKFGDRTLQVYMTHIWCRNTLVYVGFFTLIKKSGSPYLALLVLIGSAGLTFLLSSRLLKKLFDFVMCASIFKKVVK